MYQKTLLIFFLTMVSFTAFSENWVLDVGQSAQCVDADANHFIDINIVFEKLTDGRVMIQKGSRLGSSRGTRESFVVDEVFISKNSAVSYFSKENDLDFVISKQKVSSDFIGFYIIDERIEVELRCHNMNR